MKLWIFFQKTKKIEWSGIKTTIQDTFFLVNLVKYSDLSWTLIPGTYSILTNKQHHKLVIMYRRDKTAGLPESLDLSELPTRDRALDPRPALRLLPTALLQDMCVAQKAGCHFNWYSIDLLITYTWGVQYIVSNFHTEHIWTLDTIS